MSFCSTNQPRVGFVECLSGILSAQLGVSKLKNMMLLNLLTPKVGAKHELLFNKPAKSWVC
jgi:hypothetical protein